MAHVTHTSLEHGAIVTINSNSHTVSLCSEEYGLCDCCDRPCTAEVTVKRADGSYRRYGYCGDCFTSLVLQGMGVARHI